MVCSSERVTVYEYVNVCECARVCKGQCVYECKDVDAYESMWESMCEEGDGEYVYERECVGLGGTMTSDRLPD